MWSAGIQARVAGSDAGVAGEIVRANKEPVWVGENFRVDACQKECLRTLDGCISSCRNPLVPRKAKKANPRQRLCPIWQRNWFRRTIVDDENRGNRITLL